MQRRVSDEYVVAIDSTEPEAEGLLGTVELISNNLASRQALTLSKDPGRANAVLGGKAHQIDGVLFQYWLTVTPVSEADDVSAVSASAYIVLPESTQLAEQTAPTEQPAPAAQASVAPAPRRAASVSIPNAGKDALISPLRIAAPATALQCGNRRYGVLQASFMSEAEPCSLLQTDARTDSIVFFLKHQADHDTRRLPA